jgi:hypothetical protein
MSQVKDDKKKIEQKTRRPYRKPELLAYGTVKDLTAAGLGSTTEQNPGKGSTKKSFL